MCGRSGGSIWLILRRGFFDDFEIRPFQNSENCRKRVERECLRVGSIALTGDR